MAPSFSEHLFCKIPLTTVFNCSPLPDTLRLNERIFYANNIDCVNFITSYRYYDIIANYNNKIIKNKTSLITDDFAKTLLETSIDLLHI